MISCGRCCGGARASWLSEPTPWRFMACRGRPRHLDFDRTVDNAERVWAALEAFGAPLESIDLSVDDLRERHRVIQLGVRPRRIDLLTDLTGVEFRDAWTARILCPVGEAKIPFIGRATLLEKKRATGRLKDKADLESLGELGYS